MSARRTRALVAAGAAFLLSAGGLGLGFARFLGSLELSESDPQRSAEAIVALTGGSQRVGDAIELLARGYGARLLITGVNERTSREEIARFNAGQQNLVACCVDLDYRARNTVGNAMETRRWVRANNFASLIVVTSNYHMPRTMAELDRVLPDVAKVPHAVVTGLVDAREWWTRPAAARLLVSEYAKYLVVVLRNRLAATFAGQVQVGDAVQPGLASRTALR